MLTRLLVTAWLLFATTSWVTGQATTTWRAENQPPVAIVEVDVGDIEHIVVITHEAIGFTDIAGFPVRTEITETGILSMVSVPKMLTRTALNEMATKLSINGIAAIVLLGPTPARELEESRALVSKIPYRPVAGGPCVVGDSVDTYRRGTPERLELTFGAFVVQDPRFPLMVAFAAWLEKKLIAPFPGSRVSVEVNGSCAGLTVRSPIASVSGRAMLLRLRNTIAQLAATGPSETDIFELAAGITQRQIRIVTNSADVAADTVQVLANGGDVGAFIGTPIGDKGSMTNLAREILQGHAGQATIFEREYRGMLSPPETLENGTLLRSFLVSGSIVLIGVAIGGVDPRIARQRLEVMSEGILSFGWGMFINEIRGVSVAGLAVPPGDVGDAFEIVSARLSDKGEGRGNSTIDEMSRTVGLSEVINGENVSIMVGLPPEGEDFVEAGQKFLSSIPTGVVSTSRVSGRTGFVWIGPGERNEITALIDVPTSPAGWIALEILQERLTNAGVIVQILAPAGRISLVMTVRGEGGIGEIDGALEKSLLLAKGKTSKEITSAAIRRVLTRNYGDGVVMIGRLAAEPFLPGIPRETELMAVESQQVDEIFFGLPPWTSILRYCRGENRPGLTPTPAVKGVRESPARKGTNPGRG